MQDNIKTLGQEVKELPKGSIVLDAPLVMKVGETRRVDAHIGFVDAHIGFNVPVEILRMNNRAEQQQIAGQANLSSK